MATSTTTGAAAATTSCGTSYQYQLPVKDAACGIPNSDEYEPLIAECAKPAGFLPYNDGCALYSLAVDQSVQDLTDCLYDAGVAWEDVWCYGSINSTATATSYPPATKIPATATTRATNSATTTGGSETSAGTASGLSKDQIGVKRMLVVLNLFFSAVLFGI